MTQEVRKALDWLVVQASYTASPEEALEREAIIEKALKGEANGDK